MTISVTQSENTTFKSKMPENSSILISNSKNLVDVTDIANINDYHKKLIMAFQCFTQCQSVSPASRLNAFYFSESKNNSQAVKAFYNILIQRKEMQSDTKNIAVKIYKEVKNRGCAKNTALKKIFNTKVNKDNVIEIIEAYEEIFPFHKIDPMIEEIFDNCFYNASSQPMVPAYEIFNKIGNALIKRAQIITDCLEADSPITPEQIKNFKSQMKQASKAKTKNSLKTTVNDLNFVNTTINDFKNIIKNIEEIALKV